MRAAQVINAIGGLTVSGVNMRGLAAMATRPSQRDLPMCMPDPDNTVDGVTVQFHTPGLGSNRLRTEVYRVGFVLLHSEVGAGRVSVLEMYPDLIAKAQAISNAVHDSTTLFATANAGGGKVKDIRVVSIGNVGLITGASGNSYNGCAITFEVTEYV